MFLGKADVAQRSHASKDAVSERSWSDSRTSLDSKYRDPPLPLFQVNCNLYEAALTGATSMTFNLCATLCPLFIVFPGPRVFSVKT